MTDLTRTVERHVETFMDRGRTMIVRMAPEGIYMKQKGQRWTSAVFLPWGAAWSVGCKMAAAKAREERRARRAARGAS